MGFTLELNKQPHKFGPFVQFGRKELDGSIYEIQSQLMTKVIANKYPHDLVVSFYDCEDQNWNDWEDFLSLKETHPKSFAHIMEGLNV